MRTRKELLPGTIFSYMDNQGRRWCVDYRHDDTPTKEDHYYDYSTTSHILESTLEKSVKVHWEPVKLNPEWGEVCP